MIWLALSESHHIRRRRGNRRGKLYYIRGHVIRPEPSACRVDVSKLGTCSVFGTLYLDVLWRLNCADLSRILAFRSLLGNHSAKGLPPISRFANFFLSIDISIYNAPAPRRQIASEKKTGISDCTLSISRAGRHNQVRAELANTECSLSRHYGDQRSLQWQWQPRIKSTRTGQIASVEIGEKLKCREHMILRAHWHMSYFTSTTFDNTFRYNDLIGIHRIEGSMPRPPYSQLDNSFSLAASCGGIMIF